MSEIDDRIVNMQFNNKQFESGVQTSVKSLDNLKAGLNLDGATKSLSNLDRAGKNFSLAGLASGVETISNKFSALGIIGITALMNIANQAVNTGKRLLSSLTIDPIKAGLKEYETKMGAIQTILTNTASKGTTLQDVNKTLNELNEYSDKTIYNFAQMAKNIGTFTAAGVGLETSATAIKGIANLAAGSGSTADQASNAMYQLSQALASGSVKLMDWNSVVNSGMGGELFQNALKATAKQMGVVVKAGIPFRETLESGWITSEVLTKTLAKFAADESLIKAATQVKTFTQLLDTMKESVQSGWAQTWESIIGNKDEAAKLMTSINDAFGKISGSMADSRNKMFEFWKGYGGRATLINALGTAFKGLQSIITSVTSAFGEIFPAMTGMKLVELTNGFSALVTSLTKNLNSFSVMNDLKNTFKGFFAVLDIGRMLFVAVIEQIAGFVKSILPAGSSILKMTGSFGEYLVSVRDMIKSTDMFRKAFADFGAFIKPVTDKIKMAFDFIITTFKSFGKVDMSGLDVLSEKVKTRFAPFAKLGEIIGKIFSKIFNVAKKFAPFFGKLASIAGDGITKFLDSISKGFDTFNFDAGFDLLNSGIFAMILVSFNKFIASLTGVTTTGKGFLDTFKGILSGVSGSLQAFQSSLKAKTLLTIATSIGILAASLLVISLIDSDKLALSLTAVSVMFGELVGSITLMAKIMGPKGFAGFGMASKAFVSLAAAVLILAIAMKTIAALSWEDLAKGLIAITVLIAAMVIAAQSLSTYEKKMVRGAFGLVVFAGAILILTQAVKALGVLDPASLTKGLIGVGVLLAELAIFSKVTNLDKGGVTKGLGMLALAGAIAILATTVQTFSNMDTGKLIQGLEALGMVLLQLGVFINLTGGSAKVISSAIGLTILASSLLIFSNVIGTLGAMPVDQLIQGLIGMAAALGIVALAMLAMQGALPGAAAMLIVSAALAIMAPVLKSLGEMSLTEIGTGLLALAGVFVVVGLAGLLLAPIVGPILALAAAIALMGLGVALVGGGLLAFSAGLSALAVSGAAGAAALVVIITAIISLVPLILRKLGEGLVELIKIIGERAPEIATAIVKLVKALIVALVEVVPLAVDGLMILLRELVEAMVKFIPYLVDAGMKLIIGILEGIRNNIGKMATVAIDIVINFLNAISAKIPEVIQAGVDLLLSFINGIAEAIRGNTQPLIDAGTNIVDAIVGSVGAGVSKFWDVGVNVVNGFINGLKSKIDEAATWAKNIGQSVLDAINGVLRTGSPAKETAWSGEMAGQGLANGVIKSTPGAVAAATQMATNVKTAVSKPFTSMWDNQYTKNVGDLGTKAGVSMGDGVAKGVTASTPKVVAASKKLGTTAGKAAVTATKSSLDAFTTMIDDKKYYNKLSLNEELAGWESMQKIYKEGTEERKKADREVYRLKNELQTADEEYSKNVLAVEKDTNEKRKQLEKDYYAVTKEINDKLLEDIRSLTDEYNNAVKSRADSLYSAYSLFDEVTPPEEPITGMKLLTNLQSQVDAFRNWQIDMQSLAGKGIDAGLIKELEDMGPQSAEQIRALTQLSKPYLDAYVSLWQTKHNSAKVQAVGELEGLRLETLTKIDQIHLETGLALDDYRRTWASEMLALTTDANAQLTTLKTDWLANVGTLRVGTEQEFATMATNIQAEMNKPEWSELGKDIVAGITLGVMSEAMVLANATADAATGALIAAKNAIGAHSPSTEFAKIGMYSMQGFAQGITNFAGNVIASAKGVGVSAISALQSTVAKISDVVSNSIDGTPVIRPVLDLSDIITGTSKLNALINQNRSFSASSANSKVSSISQGMQPYSTIGQTSEKVKRDESILSKGIVQNVNIHSPIALSPSEVARQSKRALQELALQF